MTARPAIALFLLGVLTGGAAAVVFLAQAPRAIAPADTWRLPAASAEAALGRPDLICKFWRDAEHHFRYSPKHCYTVRDHEHGKD